MQVQTQLLILLYFMGVVFAFFGDMLFRKKKMTLHGPSTLSDTWLAFSLFWPIWLIIRVFDEVDTITEQRKNLSSSCEDET